MPRIAVLPMTVADLHRTATALVAPGKGILAADESTSTIGKRFASIGVESTPNSRRDYRELLFTAPAAAETISGVILYDETLRQAASDGARLAEHLVRAGIQPGIKVDTGAKPLAGFPGETVTEGLDGLRERLEEYRGLGATFAKWRAVITIADGLPTDGCLTANAHALARYAALCQAAGIVPIVEPEVLMDGGHDLARAAEVTERALQRVFAALVDQRVALEGVLLKPNMVVPGTTSGQHASVDEVADATLAVLARTVPAAVPGIVFLSGGQGDVEATAHLDAMNRRRDAAGARYPWALSFSYGRALQQAALKTWSGDPARREAAQAAFLHRARCNGAAALGRYTAALEAGG
jgi:fructose-bisphosphate aldolase class I